MSMNPPITAEPEGDWQRADMSAAVIPEGPFVPLVSQDPPDSRGRRRDALEFVSVGSVGTTSLVQTIYLTTGSNGLLTPQDPWPVMIRSGNVLRRKVRLVGAQTSPILGVLVSTDSNPGMGNSALITPGDPDIEFADGDLWVSCNIPNIVGASLSGYLVIQSYTFDPGYLKV